VAAWTSPATRYERLAGRRTRPLTKVEAAGRDRAEIENLNKGGPIAMADRIVVNECTLDNLKEQVERIIREIK